MHAPVFFDPTGRRSRWSKRTLGLLILIVLSAAIAFATTLMVIPRERDLQFPFPRPHASKFLPSRIKARVSAWLPIGKASDPHSPLSIGFYSPDDDASLVYRQIMYWVVIRAISSAIGGWVVGWGKLERTGRVEASPAPQRL